MKPPSRASSGSSGASARSSVCARLALSACAEQRKRGARAGDFRRRFAEQAQATRGSAIACVQTVAQLRQIARAAAAERQTRQRAREIAGGAQFLAHAGAALARIEEELHAHRAAR